MPKLKNYSGKDKRLDITGLSELAILAELHNHAPMPTDEEQRAKAILGDIDTQEAAVGYTVEEPYFPDSLFGRAIKAFIKRTRTKTFLVRCDLYDQTAGVGMAAIAVNKVRLTEIWYYSGEETIYG